MMCFPPLLYKHEHRLRSFRVPAEADLEACVTDGGEGETVYCPPEITTLFSVSALTEPLFLDANKRYVQYMFLFFPDKAPFEYLKHTMESWKRQHRKAVESWFQLRIGSFSFHIKCRLVAEKELCYNPLK